MARFYDPVLRQFTSKDPLGFGAGDANTRRFVFNDPLMYTDPSGMTAAVEYVVMGARIGAQVGAICGLVSGVVAGHTGWDLVADMLIGGVFGAVAGSNPYAAAAVLGGASGTCPSATAERPGVVGAGCRDGVWVCGRVRGVAAVRPAVPDDCPTRATHGRDRYQRALEVQHLQQRRDGRDLVPAIGHGLLAEDQAVLGGPGADQVQAPAERVTRRRPARLAVDGDGLQPGRRVQVGHPLPEAGGEHLAVQCREHPVEGVVAGDPVWRAGSTA